MIRLLRKWWLWWGLAAALCASAAVRLFWIRQTSGIDRIPGSALVLAAAVLAIIPLIRLFRSEERSDLLQKCLLVSLLVHVLLVMGFSTVRISRAIVQYVREHSSMELPINLQSGRAAEVQLQVRSQMSQISAPLPAPVIESPTPPAIEVPLQIAPASVPEIAQPAIRPSAITIAIAPPRVDVPNLLEAIAPPVAKPAPVVPQPRLPDLTPLVQAEVKVDPQAPRPKEPYISRAVQVEAPRISAPPPEVKAKDAIRPAIPSPELPMEAPSIDISRAITVRLPAPDIDISLPKPQPPAVEPPAAEIQPPRPLDPARAAPREQPEEPPIRPDISLPLDRVGKTGDSLVHARPDVRSPDSLQPAPALLETAVASSAGAVGPTGLPTLETYAQREAKSRQALVESFGGSEDTEAAVARALKYLADNQQNDGRWTRFDTDLTPQKRLDEPHEMALTALATLCFLAADHTPIRGEHSATVGRALRFLLNHERSAGDFRGDGGSMYDQAMVTVALAEAGIMAREPAYRSAAARAAKFIIDAQNGQTGGWRYTPMDAGDVSVTGWQLLALCSAAKAGAKLDDAAIARAMQYLDRLSVGDNRVLARYQLDAQPTPSMTAHAVFGRMIFGRTLTQRQLDEASEFVSRTPPGKGEKDYYRYYCTSLMLMQIQNDAWKRWNSAASAYLLKLQRDAGDAQGSWNPDDKWGKWGGRIYSTSMACLTLEVYYRYLPMYNRR